MGNTALARASIARRLNSYGTFRVLGRRVGRSGGVMARGWHGFIARKRDLGACGSAGFLYYVKELAGEA